ncbi:MAG: hypothetical protein JXX29_07195 [Deltaproteobacteria bacterium]|nr:hypothetical protein [Deltaproteobacteria bacterium]MBN2671440.1 hypothetical protein [Deltaproteobacteria bacterium]
MSDGIKNYYDDYLHRSRWLTEGARQRRAAWFETLQLEDKSSLLFRFEILVKGAVSMGNIRNFPGAATHEEIDEHNFSIELTMLLQAVEDIIDIGEQLLTHTTMLAYPIDALSDFYADDFLRAEHLERCLQQDTPEKSLHLLIGTLHLVRTLGEQTLQKETVSHRDYIAVHTVLFKEVMRSSHFNMLTLFEFRPQYDEILRHQVLLTLSSIEHEAAQRITAISLLTIFRLMNYFDVTARWDITQRTGTLYALLCLIHSDGNQFSQFLAHDTAPWLASDFGETFEQLTPEGLAETFDELNLQFQELKSLRELLESTGNQLDLELRKTFGQQLPTIAELKQPDAVLEAVQSSCNSLQSFLQNAAVLLVQEFNVSVQGDDLFEDFTSDVTRSERLRRDIWMFRQILKAFVAKTRGTESVRDRWIGLNTFKFVKTFVAYFRSMGYQLLRYSDYERFDKFMALVDRLRDGDVLEVQRLSSVVEECEAFYQFLEKMFDVVSLRKELHDVPFDTRDAAKTLKLFIT